MSDRFTAAVGRKVVSRASAEELGEISRLIVDVGRRQVAALSLGKGRKARMIEWDALSGFGPDAVMVGDESALRPPRDERERAAVDGKLELVGRLALSETGDELGTVSDVVFEPTTGALTSLVVGDAERPPSSLLGAGSYAAVFRAEDR